MSYESLGDGGFITGTMLGSGGFIVMDEDTSIVKNLYTFTRFYHHESCGQCSPCREGTGWMEKILNKFLNGTANESDVDLLWDIQSKIEGKTICPLGEAAAWPVAAAIRHFKQEFIDIAKKKKYDDGCWTGTEGSYDAVIVIQKTTPKSEAAGLKAGMQIPVHCEPEDIDPDGPDC